MKINAHHFVSTRNKSKKGTENKSLMFCKAIITEVFKRFRNIISRNLSYIREEMGALKIIRNLFPSILE